MDYTEVSNSIRMMMKAQGIDEMYIDKDETLYYDESGNVKHLIVKEGKLNANSDTVFVLGGVQADDTISLEELKSALGKSTEKEIKYSRRPHGCRELLCFKQKCFQFADLAKGEVAQAGHLAADLRVFLSAPACEGDGHAGGPCHFYSGLHVIHYQKLSRGEAVVFHDLFYGPWIWLAVRGLQVPAVNFVRLYAEMGAVIPQDVLLGRL